MGEEQQNLTRAVSFLPDRLRFPLMAVREEDALQIREIRLKRLTPVMLRTDAGYQFLRYNGVLTDCEKAGDLCRVEHTDMEDALRRLCSFSIHAFQNEMKNGYITTPGGHRVGICAGATLSGQGELTAVHNVSSMSIRIAREVPGAADELLRQCYSGALKSVLIVGEPASGKTTVLRDAVKQLSGREYGYIRVCVVDERGEIAASCDGVSRKQLGFGCDVLDGYPRADGMMIALRAMSPEIVVCDEVGTQEDAVALEQVANAGVRLLSSIHAESFAKLLRRPQFSRLMKAGAFDVAVILRGRQAPGEIAEIVSLKKYWR